MEYFAEVRSTIRKYKKKFPMFVHDVNRLENSIEHHIKQHGNYMVQYRQSKKESFAEKANIELDKIKNLIDEIEKIELIIHLSKK